ALVGGRWFGLNAIVAFWFAYIVPRPLGASFADWLAWPPSVGGLGLGHGVVSLVSTFIIIGLVGYMAASHKDVMVRVGPGLSARAGPRAGQGRPPRPRRLPAPRPPPRPGRRPAPRPPPARRPPPSRAGGPLARLPAGCGRAAPAARIAPATRRWRRRRLQWPCSPTQPASRPPRLTARSRRSVRSRTPAAATMSSRSPDRS